MTKISVRFMNTIPWRERALVTAVTAAEMREVTETVGPGKPKTFPVRFLGAKVCRARAKEQRTCDQDEVTVTQEATRRARNSQTVNLPEDS